MTRKLDIIEIDGRSEVNKNERIRKKREAAVKRPNMAVQDVKGKSGFIAFH